MTMADDTELHQPSQLDMKLRDVDMYEDGMTEEEKQQLLSILEESRKLADVEAEQRRLSQLPGTLNIPNSDGDEYATVQASASPNRQSASPNRQSVSPQRMSVSPGQLSTSSRQLSASPHQLSISYVDRRGARVTLQQPCQLVSGVLAVASADSPPADDQLWQRIKQQLVDDERSRCQRLLSRRQLQPWPALIAPSRNYLPAAADEPPEQLPYRTAARAPEHSVSDAVRLEVEVCPEVEVKVDTPAAVPLQHSRSSSLLLTSLQTRQRGPGRQRAARLADALQASPMLPALSDPARDEPPSASAPARDEPSSAFARQLQPSEADIRPAPVRLRQPERIRHTPQLPQTNNTVEGRSRFRRPQLAFTSDSASTSLTSGGRPVDASSPDHRQVAAASREQLVQCPICDNFYPQHLIQSHASSCDDADVLMVFDDIPSPPNTRRTSALTQRHRDRTPPGCQRCRLCNQLFDEGQQLLDHAISCAAAAAASDGQLPRQTGRTPPGCQRCRLCNQLFDEGQQLLDHAISCAAAAAASDGQLPRQTGHVRDMDDIEEGSSSDGGCVSPLTGGAGDANAAAGGSFVPISAQPNSFIDYHNQFRVNRHVDVLKRFGKPPAPSKRRRGRGRRRKFRRSK